MVGKLACTTPVSSSKTKFVRPSVTVGSDVSSRVRMLVASCAGLSVATYASTSGWLPLAHPETRRTTRPSLVRLVRSSTLASVIPSGSVPPPPGSASTYSYSTIAASRPSVYRTLNCRPLVWASVCTVEMTLVSRWVRASSPLSTR